MLILENIWLALTSLVANKMRALLTMLGIIIGIGSVIAIMTVGDSITNSVTSSMQSMGANNITVGLQQKSTEDEVTESGMKFEGGPRGRAMSDEDYITDEMLEELEKAYPQEIDAISLSESVGSATAEDGKLYANINITGVNDGYLTANELELLKGRSLTDVDQEKAKKVALVSDKLVNNLFEGDTSAAIGETIEVTLNNKYYIYTIVGVYEYSASSFGFSSDSEEDISTDVYIPLKTAQNQSHNTSGYSQFTVITSVDTDSTTFMETVESFFDQYYGRNENYQISAYSMESMISSMTEMLSTISVAIAIIAGISLLVGGIGVMNIMLVSITERTREIGTRKALGATNASIRLQFIMESVVICLLGGFIGIVLGIILGSVAVSVMGYDAQPSIGGIIFSVSFSILIGVFFGYYPANKAAKMNPIEALRYE
ncbi:MAG: ABC transporter permease [Lachnospiraceae bacterium]|nr:ABC transporter permease [Lachnospiraceae bacterium]